MANSEQTRQVYEQLADWYDHDGQPKLRDWFLVLAADTAQTAGQDDEAERLRGRLLQRNPHHLLKPFASYAEALRSPDVQGYVADLRRTYPPAAAEQLLKTHQAQGEAGPAAAPPVTPKPAAAAKPSPVPPPEEPELKVYRVRAEPDEAEEPVVPMPRQAPPPRPTPRQAPPPAPARAAPPRARAGAAPAAAGRGRAADPDPGRAAGSRRGGRRRATTAGGGGGRRHGGGVAADGAVRGAAGNEPVAGGLHAGPAVPVRGLVPVSDLLQFEDPCVLFALGREAQPFLRDFPPQQRFPGAPCRARFCGPAWLTVLVAQPGVGRARTTRALDWLLGRPKLVNVGYRPKLVLSAGFAGGLQDQLLIGDLVLATEVLGADGRAWPCTWPAGPLPGRWEPPLRRGRLVTAPQIIADPAAKRALGQQHDALAVDMESAFVAERCTREGVPFGCVRAISDGVDTRLSPRLAALLAGGGVSWWRLLTSVARAPGLPAELWRLARHTRYAADQLGKGLGELLTLTLPWADKE